ncbi:MAG: PPC domain-containing protein, partial [Pseudomonadota bacterium]
GVLDSASDLGYDTVVVANAFETVGVDTCGYDGDNGGGGGGDEPSLDNGVPVTGIQGAQGEEVEFFMEVPAGASNLSFNISGGSGDADLYVRFGSAPSTSQYDCRPYINGNIETCQFNAPSAGTYYIMLRGYRSFSGVSLVGSYD